MKTILLAVIVGAVTLFRGPINAYVGADLHSRSYVVQRNREMTSDSAPE